MPKPDLPANLFARSNFQNIVEDIDVFPSGGPSSDDCYTTLLHNPQHGQTLSVSERSGNAARGCYTNDLHNRTHFVRRGGRIYYRRSVPTSLCGIVGKREIWRSLGTDSPSVAVRRSHRVAAEIERGLEAARLRAGLLTDQMILSGVVAEPVVSTSSPSTEVKAVAVATSGPTLRELYDAYMADPTRDWSPRTRFAYETTRRMVLAVLGGETPVRAITRAHCRDLIETLRWLPRNATKLYPGLSPVEVAAASKAAGRTDLINAANLNAYLNKLGGVFNWAVKEEMIDRNPAQGLKVPDPMLRRDKRLPFSMTQLRAIFAAPLYTGCRNDA